MKKITLTALLMATAITASAQVAISGRMGQYYDNTKTGTTSATGFTSEPTSHIKFTVQEDLGSGLKANVVVDTRLAPDDPTSRNTQLGDRQSTIGLSNSFGSIDLGRNTHPLFNTHASTDAFGVMYGSIFDDIHHTHNKRFSDGSFVTLNPAKNASVSYARQAVQTGQEATSYNITGTVQKVRLSYAKFELDNANKSDTIGAVARFGSLRVNGSYSKDTENNVERTGKSVGGSYQLSAPVVVKATYGVRTGGTGDVKAYNVGFDYSFSKRTVAQFVYRNVDAPQASSDIKQVGVGILHRF